MIKPVSSKKVKARHLKIAFWGDTGTRKTETFLRFFPDCALIDTEGNGEMAAGVNEVPEFLYFKTKDAIEVADIINDASKGSYKFDDGRPVQSVCIDSTSVLWSVQQEVANRTAYDRAARWDKNKAADANPAQADWAKVKRPMRSIANATSNSPIKYLIYTARQKDLYEEQTNDKGKKELVKIGVIQDWVKNTGYDLNLILYFGYDKAGTWYYKVTKVQGKLADIFPINSVGYTFPIEAVMSFALTGEFGDEASEETVVTNIIKRDLEKVRTLASLQEFASEIGIPSESFRECLRSGGWTTYNASRHEDMELYLRDWLAQVKLETSQDTPQEAAQ